MIHRGLFPIQWHHREHVSSLRFHGETFRIFSQQTVPVRKTWKRILGKFLDTSKLHTCVRNYVPYLCVEALVFVRGVRFRDPGSGSRVFGDRRPVLLSSEFRNVIVDIEHDDSNDTRSSQRRGTCRTGPVIVDWSFYDYANCCRNLLFPFLQTYRLFPIFVSLLFVKFVFVKRKTFVLDFLFSIERFQSWYFERIKVQTLQSIEPRRCPFLIVSNNYSLNSPLKLNSFRVDITRISCNR